MTASRAAAAGLHPPGGGSGPVIPAGLGRLLRVQGRHGAIEVKPSTLAADTGGADRPLGGWPLSDHLQERERLMVVGDQPAWARPVVDPSLALAAVGAFPARLLQELEWLGRLLKYWVRHG